jgi:hypothetical protein
MQPFYERRLPGYMTINPLNGSTKFKTGSDFLTADG